MKPLTGTAKPGDIFYIPALNKDNSKGFVLARYIELLKTNVGYLIEVFETFYVKPPLSIAEVDTSTRLFRPVMFDMYFQYVPRWRILFNDPGYTKVQSNYAEISMAFYTKLWVGGNDLPLPPDGGRNFEDSICWTPLQVIFRVNAHLAGIFSPEERYDFDRVPKELDIDNIKAFEQVLTLANEIDSKFRSWERTSPKSSRKNRPRATVFTRNK